MAKMVDQGSVVMRYVSGLSIASCLAVIICFWKFKKLRNKNYKYIMLYISICDLLSSVGTAFGLVRDGTIPCWIQGLLTNIFPISSLFWTSLIAHRIVTFMRPKSRKDDDEIITLKTHMFFWLFPAVVSLLPLTTSDYGCGGERGHCWCFISDKEHTTTTASEFWYIFGFYLWLWIAMLYYCVMLVTVVYYGREFSEEHRVLLNKRLTKLLGYPIIIFVCWGLTTVYDIYESVYPSSKLAYNEGFTFASNILPCMQGTLTGIVFFMPYSAKIYARIMKLKWIRRLLYIFNKRKHASSKNIVEYTNKGNTLIIVKKKISVIPVQMKEEPDNMQQLNKDAVVIEGSDENLGHRNLQNDPANNGHANNSIVFISNEEMQPIPAQSRLKSRSPSVGSHHSKRSLSSGGSRGSIVPCDDDGYRDLEKQQSNRSVNRSKNNSPAAFDRKEVLHLLNEHNDTLDKDSANEILNNFEQEAIYQRGANNSAAPSSANETSSHFRRLFNSINSKYVGMIGSGNSSGNHSNVENKENDDNIIQVGSSISRALADRVEDSLESTVEYHISTLKQIENAV